MAGHLVRGPDGHLAFVPPPLPPHLELTRGLVADLSAADRSLGVLSGIGTRLPDPYLLITPFLRREAVLSSRIEGTQASVSDVLVFEAARAPAPPASSQPASAQPASAQPASARSPLPARDRGAARRSLPAGSDDVLEVANYVQALEFGISAARPLPLGLRLIRELHRILMTGVRGQEAAPGAFRTEQNWIGPAGIALADAVYVPPPVPQMHDALEAFGEHLHEPSDLPPLIRLATIHYQFEAIHPFLDGNGRIGRLLVSLLLREWGLMPQPLLYLSAFFERHRREYYAHLLAVSRSAAWESWLRFFLAGVAEQAQDAVDRSTRLLELRDDFHRRLQSARASSLAVKLADDLFSRPAISVGDAARSLGVTRRAAQMNVDKLTQAGILAEVTGGRRNRVWLAREIVQLLEA